MPTLSRDKSKAQFERPRGDYASWMTGGYIATQGDVRRFVPEDPNTERNKNWYQQAKGQYKMALNIAAYNDFPVEKINDAAKNIFKLIGEQAMSWLSHNDRTKALVEYKEARSLAEFMIPYSGDMWLKKVNEAESIIKSPTYCADKSPTEQFSLLINLRDMPDKVCLRLPREEY